MDCQAATPSSGGGWLSWGACDAFCCQLPHQRSVKQQVHAGVVSRSCLKLLCNVCFHTSIK